MAGVSPKQQHGSSFSGEAIGYFEGGFTYARRLLGGRLMVDGPRKIVFFRSPHHLLKTGIQNTFFFQCLRRNSGFHSALRRCSGVCPTKLVVGVCSSREFFCFTLTI